jgi:hypothetical protein
MIMGGLLCIMMMKSGRFELLLCGIMMGLGWIWLEWIV